MIKLECEATVTYTCYLTNEDEKKVINYFNDNKDKFKELNNTTARWIVNELYDNDMVEDNCSMSIFCNDKELIPEYKYKILSKLQRRLGKQIALIKQTKKEINSDGYNYTYGGVKVLRKRLRGLKCAYNLSKDESIKEQINKLEEIIKIKEGVAR